MITYIYVTVYILHISDTSFINSLSLIKYYLSLIDTMHSNRVVNYVKITLKCKIQIYQITAMSTK